LRLAPPICLRKEEWIDLAMQPVLGVLCRCVEIGVVQFVSDHHEIDVAMRGVGLLRDGPINKGRLDRAGVRFERLSDGLCKANRLLDEPAQFLKDGGVPICPVMLAVGDTLDRDKPATL
jgi:hypothetical protein